MIGKMNLARESFIPILNYIGVKEESNTGRKLKCFIPILNYIDVKVAVYREIKKVSFIPVLIYIGAKGVYYKSEKMNILCLFLIAQMRKILKIV